MIIQIYALTDLKTACQAVQLGVEYIGLVVGKYDLVFAELGFSQAQEIVSALPPQATAVALTMSADIEEILRMANAVQPAIVHISSDLMDVDVPAMRELRNRLHPEIRLMKAIPVQDESSISIAQDFAEVSDLLLLDSKHEGFPGVGATGLAHDWKISAKIVDAVSIPVILAGGLSQENVAEAMQIAKPFGVDSNTSTNVQGSRVEKDLHAIANFVKAVRSAERDLERMILQK